MRNSVPNNQISCLRNGDGWRDLGCSCNDVRAGCRVGRRNRFDWTFGAYPCCSRAAG